MKLTYNFVKWIGGGLGWTLGGPLFGVLGFIAGTVIDSLEIGTGKKDKTIGAFSTGLLVLIAAVMNADKPVTKSELDFVKQFLKKNFGEDGNADALIRLEKILQQNIPLDEACKIMRNSLHYSTRMQLTGFLYSLAKIDGKITEAEQRILKIIDEGMGITFNKQQSAESVIASDYAVIAAYELLEISSDSSIDNVKKAYRRLAFKYHPDKTVHLDDDMKKTANEKFQQLTNAYEIIKKKRDL